MLTPILLVSLAVANPPAGATNTDGRPTTAPDALAALQTGNTRFAAGKPKAPHRDPARVRETAEGQHPFATIITCADSRLPAEMIFDQGVGDLFVVRVAGNVCDTDEIGTAEYGAGHLHTPLIMVMGHTSCGAVKAVCENAKVGPNIAALVDNIAPAVARARETGLAGDALVLEAVTQNVWQSIADLLTHSAEVRELVTKGEVAVVGAVYDISSGRVEVFGEHPAQSGLLAKGPTETHPAASAFVPASGPAPAEKAHPPR